MSEPAHQAETTHALVAIVNVLTVDCYPSCIHRRGKKKTERTPWGISVKMQVSGMHCRGSGGVGWGEGQGEGAWLPIFLSQPSDPVTENCPHFTGQETEAHRG